MSEHNTLPQTCIFSDDSSPSTSTENGIPSQS